MKRDIEPWYKRAACIGLGDLFDLDTPRDRGAPHLRLLKSICDECPVINECLQESLEFEEEYGFRGGLSPDQRRRKYGLR